MHQSEDSTEGRSRRVIPSFNYAKYHVKGDKESKERYRSPQPPIEVEDSSSSAHSSQSTITLSPSNTQPENNLQQRVD